MREEQQVTQHTHVAQEQPKGTVGLRGCWELLIKIIILVILILILLAYWFGWFGTFGPFGPRGDGNRWAWLWLLILIFLLLWLIWRQKHFVMLNCGLTQPTGCKHGNTTILPGRSLIPITGTANGIGFSRYELEVLFGATVIPGAVVYANGVGAPDTTLTFGNHQVTSGTLGFVDATAARTGAGAGFLLDTNFTVRLRVIGIDSSSRICTIGFRLTAARSFIKKVGAAWAHLYNLPAEVLCRVPSPAPPAMPAHTNVAASIGGGVTVRGSADVYGCLEERVSVVRLWAIPDEDFTFVAPLNGTPIVPPVGGISISNVQYTTDEQRNFNRLDADSEEGAVLTYADGWSTRWICNSLDVPPWFDCFIVPSLVPSGWSTGATGKYTLLLAVEDTAGHTYYDAQNVWVDNDNCKGRILTIGGLSGCLDLRLSDFATTNCQIRGYAWDRAIQAADGAPALPNDNFSGYSLSFKKDGTAAADPITVATPGVRVPNIWADTLPAGSEGLLADWDIVTAINNGAAAPGPDSNKLQRGTRCAYVLKLTVSDNTLVGDGGGGHSTQFDFAINIINDLTA